MPAPPSSVSLPVPPSSRSFPASPRKRVAAVVAEKGVVAVEAADQVDAGEAGDGVRGGRAGEHVVAGGGPGGDGGLVELERADVGVGCRRRGPGDAARVRRALGRPRRTAQRRVVQPSRKATVGTARRSARAAAAGLGVEAANRRRPRQVCRSPGTLPRTKLPKMLWPLLKANAIRI